MAPMSLPRRTTRRFIRYLGFTRSAIPPAIELFRSFAADHKEALLDVDYNCDGLKASRKHCGCFPAVVRTIPASIGTFLRETDQRNTCTWSIGISVNVRAVSTQSLQRDTQSTKHLQFWPFRPIALRLETQMPGKDP